MVGETMLAWHLPWKIHCIIRIWLFLFLCGGQRDTFKWYSYSLDKQKAVRGIKRKVEGRKAKFVCYTLASFPIACNILLDIHSPGLLNFHLLREAFPDQHIWNSLHAIPNPLILFTFSSLHLSLTWPYLPASNFLHTWLIFWVAAASTRMEAPWEQAHCFLHL